GNAAAPWGSSRAGRPTAGAAISGLSSAGSVREAEVSATAEAPAPAIPPDSVAAARVAATESGAAAALREVAAAPAQASNTRAATQKCQVRAPPQVSRRVGAKRTR